jgi:hypothetical protein
MALAGGLALLLGSSAFAQNRGDWRTYRTVAARGFANRLVEGTVASVVHSRNGDHVRLTSGYDVFVPDSLTGNYQGRRFGAATLRPGDVVRLAVYSREGDGRDARVQSIEMVSSGSRYNSGYGSGNNSGYGSGNNSGYGSGYNSDRWVNGSVISIDRRDRTLVVQADNGRTISVDLGTYDSNGGSLRGLRRGDRISVSGRMNRGVFLADDIRFGDNAYRR